MGLEDAQAHKLESPDGSAEVHVSEARVRSALAGSSIRQWITVGAIVLGSLRSRYVVQPHALEACIS